MAITRRWQAGAESNGTSSQLVEFDSIVGSITTSNTQERTGSYSFRFGSAGSDKDDYGNVVISATRQMRIGLHLWGGIGLPGDYMGVVHWRSAGAELGSLQIDENRNIKLVILGVVQDTLVAGTTTAWTHWGIDVKIDNAAGWVSVYKDGVKVLSFNGNTGNADLELVRLGNNASFGGGYSNGFSYCDDIFIDDTAGESDGVVPDHRFEYITPNGNGNYSQCMGSDGNQVNNYLLVDERPNDGDTTYVEANALNEKDTYAMTTYSLPTGWKIEAVIPVAICKKSDGGTDTEIALLLRESATDDEGAAQDAATSYDWRWERFTTKPPGGAWTQAALDGLEVGFAGKGTF